MRIEIQAVIDRNRIGALQVGVYALCGLCLVMDGFDVQAMGYVAPAIVKAWAIDKASLGPVFGAGLFGMLLGSLFLSPLADRLGRRPLLIGASACFAAGMLATPLAGTVAALLGIRFLTGLGLGCIMPNAMALAGEYSPAGSKATLMMLVSCGFTVGAALGGFAAAALIPAFGWPAVFYVGGAAPLVIAALMLRYLPESLPILVQRRRFEQAMAILRRIEPGLQAEGGDRAMAAAPRPAGVPAVQLFRGGKAAGTLLLWGVNFMNLVNLYFLSNWLPTLFSGLGHGTAAAALAGTVLQLGGIAGTLALGRIIDRRGYAPVLAATFLLAALSIALIGRWAAVPPLASLAIFIAGFGVVGGQPAVNALAAEYYPAGLRATGIGWSLGVGRIGSILGPVLGGILIGQGWPAATLFLAAAVPALLCALMMLGMRRRFAAVPPPSRAAARE